MEEDESQKTEEPSEHKLQEARKKGDVPKSQDIATLFILAAGVSVLLTFGVNSAKELSVYITAFLERPDQIAVDVYLAQGSHQLVLEILIASSDDGLYARFLDPDRKLSYPESPLPSGSSR